METIQSSEYPELKRNILIKFIQDTSVPMMFVLFVLAQFVVVLIERDYLVTENLIILHFDAILTSERIEDMLRARQEYWWFRYAWVILYYPFKFAILSLMFLTGALTMRMNIRFVHILKIVIVSEFSFLIPRLIEIIWFLFFKKSYVIDDLKSFDWYLLTSYANVDSIKQYFGYPISHINLFEFGYIIFISWLFAKFFTTHVVKGINFVMLTYGIGLFLWSAVIVGLNLYLS